MRDKTQRHKAESSNDEDGDDHHESDPNSDNNGDDGDNDGPGPENNDTSLETTTMLKAFKALITTMESQAEYIDITTVRKKYQYFMIRASE